MKHLFVFVLLNLKDTCIAQLRLKCAKRGIVSNSFANNNRKRWFFITVSLKLIKALRHPKYKRKKLFKGYLF